MHEHHWLQCVSVFADAWVEDMQLCAQLCVTICIRSDHHKPTASLCTLLKKHFFVALNAAFTFTEHYVKIQTVLPLSVLSGATPCTILIVTNCFVFIFSLGIALQRLNYKSVETKNNLHQTDGREKCGEEIE